MRTSFRQISPQIALKILAGRKPACGFLPTLQQNYARKSAHISYEDRFLKISTKAKSLVRLFKGGGGQGGGASLSLLPQVRTSHDHHFKWWFEISPIRALLQARPKGRISQANYRLPLKEVIYAYLLAWFLLPVRQYTF